MIGVPKCFVKEGSPTYQLDPTEIAQMTSIPKVNARAKSETNGKCWSAGPGLGSIPTSRDAGAISNCDALDHGEVLYDVGKAVSDTREAGPGSITNESKAVEATVMMERTLKMAVVVITGRKATTEMEERVATAMSVSSTARQKTNHVGGR